MSRSKWKLPVFEFKTYKKIFNSDFNVKIWSRNMIIPENLVGKRVLIHNGIDFKKVLILREKVGFKFGEFTNTRKYMSKILNKKKIKK